MRHELIRICINCGELVNITDSEAEKCYCGKNTVYNSYEAHTRGFVKTYE